MTRNQVRQRWNRLLSFLMALIVLFMMSPQTVEAYIGAIRDISSSTDQAKKMRSGRFMYNGDMYMYIENDYIHFDVCVQGLLHKNYTGVRCHTIPTALLEKDKKGNFIKLDEAGYQVLTHTTALNCYDHSANWTDEKVSQLLKDFTLSKKQSGFESCEDLGDQCIAISPILSNKSNKFDVKVYFTLVELDQGDTDCSNFPQLVNRNPEDTSVNWGVRAKAVCTQLQNGSTDIMLGEEADHYRLTLNFVDFAKTGHANVDPKAPRVMAQMMKDSFSDYQTWNVNIDAGIGITKRDNVAEVYSDSYGFGAPFVAGTYKYSYYDMHSDTWTGVEGHTGYPHYTANFGYENGNLLAIGASGQVDLTKGSQGVSNSLWGFRFLKTKSEVGSEPEVIEAENVIVQGNGYLYVMKDSKGNCSVQTADSVASIPSNAVAYFYGEHELDRFGWYHFKKGALQLSPTIKMLWDEEKEKAGDIDVKLQQKTAKFEFPADKVNLETPSSKFYIPTDEADENALKFVGYDVYDSASKTTQKGLVLDINPEMNDAIFNISLPGNGCEAKRAIISKSGEIQFTGRIELSLFLAEIEMDRLSYDRKDGGFGVKGVSAKGMLKAPTKTGFSPTDSFSVFGFDGSNITGDISTFPEDEHYAFTLTLSVQDLFSSEAGLKLVRIKNGQLIPDSLELKVNIDQQNVGLDITPSTPVITLTGFGGGVYNIAQQVQGDYASVPPILIKLNGHGKLIKIIDGDFDLWAGPSKLRLEANDLGFKVDNKTKIEIIKQLGAGVYLQDKTLKYQGNKFQGYEFGGGMNIDIAMIPRKHADTKLKKAFVDTVTAGAAVSAKVIVAENQYPNVNLSYGYLGIAGKGYCAIKVPIIDYELVKGSLDVSVAGEGTVRRGSSPLKGMHLTGGIGATAQVGKIGYGQVIYKIEPNTIEVDGGFGTADDIDFESLAAEYADIIEAREGYELVGVPVPVTMEDGTESVALYLTNLHPIEAQVTDVTADMEDSLAAESTDGEEIIDSQNAYSKQVSLDMSTISGDDGVVLTIIPADQKKLDEIMSSVSVSELNGWTKVIPSYATENGEEFVTNNSEINVWKGVYEFDDNYESVETRAVYLSIEKDQLPTSGIFDVSADAGFTVEVSGAAPVTGVSGSVNDHTLQVNIDNPAEGKAYNLTTYYGAKNANGEVTQDYMLDSQVVAAENTGSQVTITLPESGYKGIPSGDYYVSTILTDSEGIPIETYVSDSTVSYQNSEVPNEPDVVTLEMNGNESMRATWSEVADTEDAKVAGYQISILESVSGNYIDTGRGYNYTVDQLAVLKDEDPSNDPIGLAYDNGKFSLDMALTVNGDETENGENVNAQTGEEEEEEPASGPSKLKAGTDYKVAVSAYSANQVSVVDENDQTQVVDTPAYSKQKISSATKLVAYEALNLDIQSNGDGTLTKDEKTGIYDYKSKSGSFRFGTPTTSSGSDVAPEDVTYEVTYQNVEGQDAPMGKTDDEYYYLPQDVQSSAMVKIKAIYHHDGADDETIAYMNMELDTVPPTILFDRETFIADDEGNYTISGTTDDAVEIIENSSKGVKTVATVDEDGKFTFTGQLDKNESGETLQSDTLAITAKDACGNEAEYKLIPVTQRVSARIYTAPADAGLVYNGKEQELALPGEADGGVLMYSLTQNGTYSPMVPKATKAGTYQLWYKVKADEFHKDIEPACLEVKIAKASAAPNTPPATLNVSKSIAKVSNEILASYKNWTFAASDLGKDLPEGTAVKVTAVYNGADKGNYEKESVAITLTRENHEHVAAAPVKENVVAGTKNKPGSYDEVVYCSICHKEISRKTVITQVEKGAVLTDKKSGTKFKVISKEGEEPAVAYVGSTKKKAKTVKIPDEVTFDGVTYKVTTIKAGALKGNKKLTKVTIGRNVKTIEKNAFSGCTKLGKITIYGDNLKSVKANAFKGIKANAKFTIWCMEKKKYDKVVKMIKKRGAKKAKFKFKQIK
ncbi:MAG: leucine-rich repeat domain-containing protein [Lachnospiraceae bacterium]|nr:leucine-rich repeat domain-containing protein [Lachnospiraceae bacterium]